MLPYPHGSAAGQIAHNAFYDTGFTPGSTLGKFIGFGEEGTSNIANRAHWALSANIDYVYQILALNRSIPKSVSFTASGSPGQNMYQFADDVFTGDSTYPGTAGSSDPMGMRMLYAVLDTQFNILMDSTGHEVRVKRVRETTGATDIYKSGFATNPRIYFCTVTSDGTEVDPAYQIPAGTNVILLYPQRHSIEGGIGDPLPTDAFSRFEILGAATTGAAFLIDGSRKMVGDADWDGHKLLNLNEARGKAGADLLINSLQALKLKDTNTSAAIPFADARSTSLRNPGTIYTSLLGELNSKTYANESLHANRTLVRGGPIYFQSSPPFMGRILLPTGMVVMLNGEAIDVGGLSIYANNGPTECCVLQANGTLALKDPATILGTDVLLTYHNWNGTVFSPSTDCRWILNKETGHFEIIASTTLAGANATTLNEAILITVMYNRISRLGATGSQLPRPCVIRVKGDLITGPAALNDSQSFAIFGDGIDSSTIYTDGTMGGLNSDLLACNSGQLHLKGLKIVFNETVNQGAVGACISEPGHRSVIEDCQFQGSPGMWTDIIKATTFGYSRTIIVRNCTLASWTGYAVNTAATAQTKISDCFFTGGAGHGCKLGSNSSVQGCGFYVSGYRAIEFAPNPFGSGGSRMGHLEVSECGFYGASHGFYYWNGSGSGLDMEVRFHGNVFEDCAAIAYVDGFNFTTPSDHGIGENSVFSFCDNTAKGTAAATAALDFRDAWAVYANNNHFYGAAGTIYHAAYSTATTFVGNYVDGFGTGPFGVGNVCVSANDTMVGPTIIANNTLLSAGSTAGRVNVSVGGSALVSGNKVEGSATVTHGISANYYDINNAIRIIGNDVSLQTDACIDVRGYAVTDHLNNGPVVIGNTACLAGGTANGAAIYLDTVPGVSVIGNTIGSWDGMKGGGLYLAPASSIGGTVIGCDGASVIGNTFWRVRGYGPAYLDPTPRLAVCDLSNGNTRAVSAIGNTFNECGEFLGAGVPNGTYQDILYCEAFDSLVQGNTFWQCQGIQNSTCFMSHIRAVGWRNTIIGNHIRYSMLAATPPYDTYTTGTMFGILDASWKSVVMGNNIAFGGTIVSGGPAAVIGIQLTSACTSSVVVGNRTSVWDVTGAGAYAIHVNASEVVVVGNMAEAHDIWTVGASCILNSNFCAGHDAGGTGRVQCLSGGSSMCLGNVSLGTGGTNPGTASIAGNI